MARRTRRRIVAAVTLAIAVAVVVVLVLHSRRSPTTARGPAISGAGVATVQRRDLVATDIESGTLGYADPRTVYNRLSGTITWLPAVGRVIRPGQVLFRVGGDPVVLMDGVTPAYRDLGPDDPPGPDVAQLNRNLIRLGFEPDAIVADDEWQPATSAGVEQLQQSFRQAPTGTLTLGQVVFLPGPQLVSAVDATVGGTGGESGSAASAAVNVAGDASAVELVGLHTHPGATTTTTTGTVPTTTTPTTTATATTTITTTATTTAATVTPTHADPALNAAIGRLSAEIAQLRRQLHTRHPARRSRPGSRSGADLASSGEQSATAILQTSSTRLDVTVDLPAGAASEAVVGATVKVELPNGITIRGTIASVSHVAQSNAPGSPTGGGGSSSTVPVTIRLHDRHAAAGLDQATVSVEFVKAGARHVLSVPVTALVAIPGGGYALAQTAAPHRLIPVHTGMFAAGYVQVSGPGIVPGLHVSNSEG